MKKQEACPHCEAEWTLSYKLNKDYYQPKFCPFCGEQNAEDEYDVEVPEDE